MRRADRIKALAERRRQRVVLFVFFKSRTGPPKYFGAVVRGSRRPITDAEIEAAQRANLAAWELKRASKPKHLKASPRPLGNKNRTLAARAAVADAKKNARTRLAKCAGCGFRAEVRAHDDDPATCPRCGRGDL